MGKILFSTEGLQGVGGLLGLLTSMLVFGSVWSDLLVLHNYSVIISECQKLTFLVDQKVYPWIFPSLLDRVGVTIEKGLHWLP